MSGYADATRSIEYAALASFFSREGEFASDLVEYFGSFQQVVSYLFDPDEIFGRNLRRAGVRNLIVGSPKISGLEHAARELARPLESLALYLDDAAADLQPNEPRVIDCALVAIHPGSGSETKNWPINRWIALARDLLEAREDRRLLLVGGEADQERLRQLVEALPDGRIRLANNLDLTELAARLQACAAFVGHDSGISHLAAAVGTSCLLLFGPTDPAIWAPANPQVRVLHSATGKMAGLGVAEVLAACAELTS